MLTTNDNYNLTQDNDFDNMCLECSTKKKFFIFIGMYHLPSSVVLKYWIKSRNKEFFCSNCRIGQYVLYTIQVKK